MKKHTSISLTRTHYREFATLAKSFGLGVVVSTVSKMKCWAAYSPMAEDICGDAREPSSNWHQRGVITLARTINIAKFRDCGARRPELDWAALESDNIYPFLFWHEIGHRMDNFDHMIAFNADPEIRKMSGSGMDWINEVLADRYAWKKVRPSEEIPLSALGSQPAAASKTQALLAAFLGKVEMTSRYRVRPLRDGIYCDVPGAMLATPSMAAFIGPEVSRALLSARARRNISHAAAQ